MGYLILKRVAMLIEKDLSEKLAKEEKLVEEFDKKYGNLKDIKKKLP